MKPTSKKVQKIVVGSLIAFSIPIYINQLTNGSVKEVRPVVAKSAEVTAAERSQQQTRNIAINELIKNGVINKIETTDGYPFVFVGDSFLSKSTNHKVYILKIIEEYYNKTVFINHSATGNPLGEYSRIRGLDWN